MFRAIFILYLYVNLCSENLLDNSEGHYTIIDITGDEMTKKEILLSCLTAQPGEFVSGEEISRRLNVTRTAVWQLINDLRQEGYDVVGKPKYGYKISESSDVLSAQGLEKLIQPSSPRIRVEVCDEVESTNQTLRERAERGEEAGLFFLARSQTKGRGRLGRSFFSPKDAGLYMSLLLRPEKVDAEKATRYTTLAAVAVCDAIEETTDLQPEVKWVNDVLVNGRKVCGVLTEASIGLENRLVEYLVVGVGVNLYEPQEGVPDELADIVGHVFSERKGNGRNLFAATFVNAFMKRLSQDEETVYHAYRSRLTAIGEIVEASFPNGATERARIIDVDQDYRLIVEYLDGRRDRLLSGEVSAKPLK